MRNIKKNEKKPEAKSLLLQTYLTSLLCLVLCVTMFFGTTFAWFTAEVENKGNEIYIGTLAVEMEKKVADGWKSLTETDANGNNTTLLFDKNIRWEPGYTTLETVKIVNKGDLSFRYGLTFTDGLINGAENKAQLKAVAQNFEVYVHAGDYAEGEATPNSFAELKESNGWVPVRLGNEVATLADILERELPVLSGNMEQVVKTYAPENQPTAPSLDDSNPSFDTFIIALHMKEDAQAKVGDYDIMGQRISLNVKLTAHQRTHEQDGFGSAYDLQADVTELGVLPIWCTTWIDRPKYAMVLNAAYQFRPVESFAEAQNVPYKKYLVDFVIWADKDVPANSMAAAGYYDAWCQYNNGYWIALQSDEEIKANQEIRLVKSLGSGFDVTYEMLCEYGNDGIGFLCGVSDLTGENAGTTVTVELRMYEVTMDANGHYVEKDPERYMVVGTYEHTFDSQNP